MKIRTIVFLFLLMIIPGYLIAQWETVINNPGYFIRGMHFKNDSTGYTGVISIFPVDSVFLMVTYDAGKTWYPEYVQPGNSTGMYRVYFPSENTGYTGGENGVMHKTTNGGLTWEGIAPTSWYLDLQAIGFFNDSVGIANIDRTVDGGNTWMDLGIGQFNDIFMIHDSAALCATSQGLYYTSDQGASWDKVDPLVQEKFVTVCLMDDSTGFAANDHSWSETQYIFKTLDGGHSWFKSDSLFENWEIKKIRFDETGRGYMMTGSRIFSSQDQGSTWQPTLFSDEYLDDFDVTSGQTVVVVSEDGKAFRSEEGGGIPPDPNYPVFDWYTVLTGLVNSQEPRHIMDVNSNMYVAGIFEDSLCVNGIPVIPLDEPGYGQFLIKFNPWGEIAWHKDDGADAMATDSSGNLYTCYEKFYGFDIRKYSPQGDSLWTRTVQSTNTNNNLIIRTTADDRIIIAGTFSGTISYENEAISTENEANFFLEIDPNGVFSTLKKGLETLSYIQDKNVSVGPEGCIYYSFRAPGVIINGDTLADVYNHLFKLDTDYNVVWYNKEFSDQSDRICSIETTADDLLLVATLRFINDSSYGYIYQYDSQGDLVNSRKITGGYFNFSSSSEQFFPLVATSNQRILAAGRYGSFSQLPEDTLWGHHRYNVFLYTLDNDLEFIKSSQIGSRDPMVSLFENNGSSFYFEHSDYPGNVVVYGDTIPCPSRSCFFGKLNSLIFGGPVVSSPPQHRLSVFPNPSTGTFSVHLNHENAKKWKVTVFNQAGQAILGQSAMGNNFTIDLNRSHDGIYYIRVQSDDITQTAKIIKQ